MGPQHAIEAQRTLQQRLLECLLKYIENIDSGNTQEFPHVFAAEASDFQAELCGREHLPASAAAETRGTPVIDASQQLRKALHAPPIRRIRVAISLADLFAEYQIAGQGQVLAIRVQRDSLQVSPAELQAVGTEFEITLNVRVQHL